MLPGGAQSTRLVLARPAFALLDRVGAALRPAQVQQALRRPDESSVTYLAFAEGAESVDLYDAVLEIDVEGVLRWGRVDRGTRRDGGRPDARSPRRPTRPR
jgi:hypothetical protein